MVDQVIDPLRNLQYRVVFFSADDTGNNYRYTWVSVCGYTRHTDACKLFFWSCGRRIYDSDLIILIMGSLILMGLGVIGYYIAKIYEEVKCRPRYIVSRKVGAGMTWEKRR